ncbi:GNAT family N-acetyltransferase [Macrococcus brunensis]|uniref:GNAT family N-acetyltransferase n=1 Tax=Macrococcus brunensis TaxID=198483 RepID=UPI001EF142BA|nr:GNAT family N-acetyltransferase [Macrococcus brunensis]ULG74953.1 GNAT family N-acetyltransferase [Macrococcus brunensis]
MFKVISFKQREEWEGFIEESNQADVYHQWGYVESYRINGDGDPILFTYKSETTEIINVVLKRDISKNPNFKSLPRNKYFDFVSPYGYGGTLIQGDNKLEIEEYFRLYNEYCTKKNIVSEFVRFNPIQNNIELLKNYYDVTTLGETVAINLHSTKMVWENMQARHRSKIRQSSRKGIEVFCTNSKSILPKFIEIYEETMTRDQADSYYFFKNDYYSSYFENLKQNFLIFYAVLNEEIISAAIILLGNRKLHYHLSGTKDEYHSLAPNNLILTEVALWGAKNGYETFHLGGGLGSREDSLLQYKKKFNKNSNLRFSIGKKIFNHEVYNDLLEKRGFEEEVSFFPEYRAANI